MNTNIKVLIASIIVGLTHAIYVFLQPICVGGFECLGSLNPVLFGVVVIPIIFGILGFLLTAVDTSWGKRFIRAISWLGISFVVIVLLNIAGAIIKRPQIKAEWDKPQYHIQNYDKNAPNYQAPTP